MADKDLSALAGAVTPAMRFPSRRPIATAVGTLTAILPSVFRSTSVAEFEDEFEPEFDDRFVEPANGRGSQFDGWLLTGCTTNL